MKFRYEIDSLYPDPSVSFPMPQRVAIGWDDRGPHVRMFLENAKSYTPHTLHLGLITDDPFVLGLVVRWFRHGKELRAPLYTSVHIHECAGMNPPHVEPPIPGRAVKLSAHLIEAKTGQLVGLCVAGVEYEWGSMLYERIHRQLELGYEPILWAERVGEFERRSDITSSANASALINHVSHWVTL